MPATDRGRPSKKKPRRKTATTRARAQERAYESQGRSVQRQASRPSRPSGALAPLGNTTPFGRQRTQQAAKTDRAQYRLPRRPLPHVPLIADPTPAQTQAARQRIARAMTRAVGAGGTGAQRLARRRQIAQEFMNDPGMARAIRHYGAAAERHMALTQADRVGVPGYRGDRERVGRLLLAMQQPLRPGPEPTRVGLPLIPGSINLTATADIAQDIGERITSGHGSVLRPGKLLGNAAQDIADFPVNAARGLYELGATVNDLAGYLPGSPQEGSTERAGAMWEGLKASALGQLLQGDLEGAGQAFAEHPIYSALDFTGAGALAGRAAGAGMRAGLFGAAARGRAGLARADLELVPGTNQRLARSYSPNQIVKEFQLMQERAARRQGLDPNVAEDSVVPWRSRKHLLNREVDEFAAQAEGLRRRGREEVGREAAGMAPTRRGDVAGSRRERAAARVDQALTSTAAAAADRPGKLTPRAERDVVAAAAEGRLVVERNGRLAEPSSPEEFRAALTRERDRLQDVYRDERRSMSRRARLGNREQVKSLDRVIGDRKALANYAEVFRAADDYRAAADDLERQLIARGALDPDQAEAAKLRAYAVSVMGAKYDRSMVAPEQMAQRHEAARAAEATAREARDAARKKVQKLAAARSRLVGTQSSRRGRRQMDEAGGIGRQKGTGKATAAERRKLEKATADLRAARAEAKAADAKWRQARRDRVKSNPRKYTLGLVDSDGNRLSSAQIREHIAANAGRAPAFFSHRTDESGARSFFVNWFGSRKTVDSKGTRTGESTRVGSHDASYKALEEHLARQKGVVDAIDAFDSFVGRFGMAGPDGKPMTWDDALARAEQAEEVTGVPMVPVRQAPARYDAATREAIMKGQRTGPMPEWFDSLVVRHMDEALADPPAGSRQTANVVLVPAQQVKRFRDHQTTSTSTAGKAGQALTRAFRGTVLPFSTKWLTGNIVEAQLRMLMAGVNPINDFRAGRMVFREMRKLDEKAWREFDTRGRGGLMYAAGDRLNVRRAADDFEGGVLETPAAVLSATARLPVVRQVLGGLKAYQRAVFALNRGYERYAQTASIGKLARRELREHGRGWAATLKLQEAAAKEVAAGLLNTKTQVRFARELDDMLGKYGRYSPSARRTIQTFAPFLPWYMNAVKFVYYTLPAKHPVQAALLTSAERAFERDIKAHRESVPPGSLEATIPLEDGGLLDVARYSPFGAFTNLPEGFADPLLPQLSSFVNIVQGRSFTGRELQTESGEVPSRGMFGKRTGLAMYSLLESAVPGIAIARRLQENGETPFDDSYIWNPRSKPGTSYGSSAANRVLNPFRPTRLGAPTGGGEGIRGSVPDRRQRLLERRAALLERNEAASARRQELLERRARLLGSP